MAHGMFAQTVMYRNTKPLRCVKCSTKKRISARRWLEFHVLPRMMGVWKSHGFPRVMGVWKSHVFAQDDGCLEVTF